MAVKKHPKRTLSAAEYRAQVDAIQAGVTETRKQALIAAGEPVPEKVKVVTRSDNSIAKGRKAGAKAAKSFAAMDAIPTPKGHVRVGIGKDGPIFRKVEKIVHPSADEQAKAVDKTSLRLLRLPDPLTLLWAKAGETPAAVRAQKIARKHGISLNPLDYKPRARKKVKNRG